MKNIYQYRTTPVADPQAIVAGETYRFTVLTPKLIRIEYNENGIFEDRATQVAINRKFEVPEFTVVEREDFLIIRTECIELTYTKQPFSQSSLKIKYIGKCAGVHEGSVMGGGWFFGKSNFRNNLKSTIRTLDRVNGECELPDGIMTRGEITALDDSKSLIIADDGRILPRTEDCIDQYVFCYGDSQNKYDYQGCLRDFYHLTGKTPMIPRFALGNWWSKYHAYTQEEYTDLMKRFKKENIPFSVAVLDMDWHYVNIESHYGTGWTGYTWNKELFPNHKEMLNFLHKEGIKVSLNLHPQEGVASHEKPYCAMAEAMGMDLESGDTVPFDITNPLFIENYFELLHHPLEKEGIDFWWMDWQQGNTTHVPGLDPLWMLNHYHYLDNEKNNTRGLLFSRYAGPGSHRYPVGFSGDSIITWESLDFQPYFTATASNIGYGWWSHDIGGNHAGYRNQELTCRWIQFGAFSPINRLHNTNSEFLGKEPWRFNQIVEGSMKKFLKLRHELIPYLYTMNYRAHTYDEPLMRPLYYEYHNNEVYEYKNEYIFGTEMIVSPITSPHDDKTMLGSVKTYIPEGEWYDFFTNIRYTGGRAVTLFRNLHEMPVLVKSGGIIPMAKLSHVNDVENPENMKIRVFTGKSNTFELYEDDGETNSHRQGAYAITEMKLDWKKEPTFIIRTPKGDITVIPEKRNYEIELIGLKGCDGIRVTENGKEKEFQSCYENNVLSIQVDSVQGELCIALPDTTEKAENHYLPRMRYIIENLENVPNGIKDSLSALLRNAKSKEELISGVVQLNLGESVTLALAEMILAEIS